jgi:hypothetical protein
MEIFGELVEENVGGDFFSAKSLFLIITKIYIPIHAEGYKETL